MAHDDSDKRFLGVDRREFLQYVGMGSAALSLGSEPRGRSIPPKASTGNDDLSANYPGARYLAGLWRLRIDAQNRGKQQQWYRREPSDAEAKAVSVMVPSVWQAHVPGFGGGIGWYFKEFDVPGDFKDRVVRLKFWAVDYFTQVWVNGEEVGSHEGGYTPFEMDITPVALRGGENRLVVRVVDPPRPYAPKDRPDYVHLVGLPGWEGTTDGVVDGFKFMEIPMGHQSWQEGFNFGGIWQPVEMLETDLVYISDIFIEPKLDRGGIEAHVEVMSKEANALEGKVRVVLRPWKEPQKFVGQGEKSERFLPGSQIVNLHVDLNDPHPWSPDDPYLYVAEVILEDGQGVRNKTTARFGLREFTVKDGYFHLNGKRIFIKGGHHQGTYPTTLESPPTREFAYNEVRIFKEAGFNLCRLWVKPAPSSFLDAADELGLMLQEEPPLSLMEDSPLMLERSVREVREMVKRDRNRPAIVVWNMINENDSPVKYVREQCLAAREVDPTRLITESAGGPSHYYLPYSQEGVSYLTEHPYPGAPIADDIYDY
jgi:beta-galactosidase/beta-glucuronidase